MANRKLVNSCVAYLTKKTKIRLTLSLSLLRGSQPRICQGQLLTMYSECPKFHPNQFTFGGVIAKCVNTIQTRDSVSNVRPKRSFKLNDEVADGNNAVDVRRPKTRQLPQRPIYGFYGYYNTE